jgi:hypothetical protein
MSRSDSSREHKSFNIIQIIHFVKELCSRLKRIASSLDRSVRFRLGWRTSSFKDDEENGDREAIRFRTCSIWPIVTESRERGPLSARDKTR